MNKSFVQFVTILVIFGLVSDAAPIPQTVTSGRAHTEFLKRADSASTAEAFKTTALAELQTTFAAAKMSAHPILVGGLYHSSLASLKWRSKTFWNSVRVFAMASLLEIHAFALQSDNGQYTPMSTDSIFVKFFAVVIVPVGLVLLWWHAIHVPGREFKKTEREGRAWLNENLQTPTARQFLKKASSSEVFEFYTQWSKEARQVGIDRFFRLFHVLYHANYHEMVMGGIVSSLRAQDYAATDLAVLNKSYLLAMTKKYKEAQVSVSASELGGTVLELELKPDQIEYLNAIDRIIRASSVLSDEPMPERSIILQIIDLRVQIAATENSLVRNVQTLVKQPTPVRKEDIATFERRRKENAEYRKALHDFDAELIKLQSQLPEDKQDSLRVTSSSEKDRFPLRGSVERPELEHYANVRAQIQDLLIYLMARDEENPTKIPWEWTVLFGSDIEDVPLGAMTRDIKRHRAAPHIVISGGKGNYMPHAYTAMGDTEADGFNYIIENTWGEDWTRPPLDIVLERESTSTAEHAEKSAQIIYQALQQEAPPLDTKNKKQKVRTVRILVHQAPAMQRRAVEELQMAFNRLDLAKLRIQIQLVSDPPFYRDYDIAPDDWSLAQWRQRLAWDLPREVAKMIGDRDILHKINSNFSIPIKQLQEALDIIDYSLADETIPAEDHKRIEAYQKTIQKELERVKAQTNANAQDRMQIKMPSRSGVVSSLLFFILTAATGLITRGWSEIHLLNRVNSTSLIEEEPRLKVAA